MCYNKDHTEFIRKQNNQLQNENKKLLSEPTELITVKLLQFNENQFCM